MHLNLGERIYEHTDNRSEVGILMTNLLGLVYIVGFFLILLLVYCVHVQLRRQKYRQIANELGAEYQSQGLFKSGKIVRSSSPRKYTVENEDGAHGSGMLTIIEMQCVNLGIPLHVHGRFFKNFPNWRGARQQRGVFEKTA